MNAPRTPDPLSPLLDRWRLAPPRNPGFRAGVWARLGGPVTAPWGAYVRRHAAAVSGVLLLAIVIGAIAGREQARARSARESARLATAYVQGLDARMMTMP